MCLELWGQFTSPAVFLLIFTITMIFLQLSDKVIKKDRIMIIERLKELFLEIINNLLLEQDL